MDDDGSDTDNSNHCLIDCVMDKTYLFLPKRNRHVFCAFEAFFFPKQTFFIFRKETVFYFYGHPYQRGV